jgi:nesprin-1
LTRAALIEDDSISDESRVKPQKADADTNTEQPLLSTLDAHTQTKEKSKPKQSEDKSISVEIQTTIDIPDNAISRSKAQLVTSDPEKSINVVIDTNDMKEPIDVNLVISSEQMESPKPSTANEKVLQRLNELITIESTQSSVPNENFVLSQNLNTLINKSDGVADVPWNELQYLIVSNIESRKFDNSLTEYGEPEDQESAVDVPQSLDKAEQYMALLPDIINKEDKLTQRTIIVITKVIVTCLEQIEYHYKIAKRSKQAPDTSDLQRIEGLLTNLKTNVDTLKNPELRNDIDSCIDTLQQHVNLNKEIENTVAEEIQIYKSEVNDIEEQLKFLRNDTDILDEKYKVLASSDAPITEKLKQLDNLDFFGKENKKQCTKLLRHNSLNDNHKQDIRECYDKTKEIQQNIRLEKRRLFQLINLSEEYEQTLNEFSQITLIADSLVDKSIITNSLDHLQNEIQRHRKFFVNLNHCRNILESLEKNLDSETRLKHAQLHNALHEKATAILEKAGERSQKLSLAASRWTLLDKRMKNEDSWLEVAEQRVPDLTSVTSADFDQYITLYQSLNSDINNHYSKMLQNYETANKLQDLICAPNIETKCNESLTKLIRLREDVLYYMKKLIMFKNTWNQYNSNADRLENWMNNVEEELNSTDIPENILNYPIESMRNFWEIKAQFEVNNQIHDNVVSNFDKALKIISIADDKLQLQFYSQLEDRWICVSNRINNVKNQITQSMSSSETSYDDKLIYLERELEELIYILNNIKGIIRNSEELNLYIERLIVLKSRITVVENELVTIGFITPTETEKVGELCNRSHKLSNQISEELELADLCKGRLNNLKQEICDIKEDQLIFYDNLKQFEDASKLESATIEKALQDCQTMKENLVAHWQDIMRVRHMLHTLPTGLRMTVSAVNIEKDISNLEDDYVDIEKKLCDIENLLKNRFGLWKRFEKQLETLQESIQETDLMVELLTVHGNIDYDRLLKATERLEVICDLSF